ncbi:MAG: 2-succinyl-6-hydroxy-2,4-cyclohexadiene-1-carboxylate synthase, partial [Acidobacteria bacterium]
PGLVSARERRERRAADERWAVLIEREGTARFAAAWSAQPLFATQRRLDRDVLARQDRIRRSHDPAGLAAAMRGFSLGRMPDLRPALARCRVPALCLAGALDERFAGLAREIASVMLDARSALVPDCGHNPVLERPDATAALVDAFWKEIA